MNDGLINRIKSMKWPFIMLALGILLMVIPGNSSRQSENSSEERLAAILKASEGVGETSVLISDTGVIVSCEGARNAQVRLRILAAVEAYTGFRSDKVTILILKK